MGTGVVRCGKLVSTVCRAVWLFVLAGRARWLEPARRVLIGCPVNESIGAWGSHFSGVVSVVSFIFIGFMTAVAASVADDGKRPLQLARRRGSGERRTELCKIDREEAGSEGRACFPVPEGGAARRPRRATAEPRRRKRRARPRSRRKGQGARRRNRTATPRFVSSPRKR